MVTWLGSVIVERKLVVTVLAGSVIVDVRVVPGVVEVIVVVIGGTTEVLVTVERIVLGGS